VTQAVEASSVNPAPPTVTTGATTGVDSQHATLGGSIDTGGQAVSYRFAYGTSPSSLTQTTASAHLGPGTSAVPVSMALSGLAASTPYSYRLDVTAGTQTYSGQVQSFTTAAAPPQSATNGGSSSQTSGGSSSGQGTTTTTQTPPPIPNLPSPATTAGLPTATTGAVSGLTSSGATVAGTVNPGGAQTSYLVEFGTTTAYGHSSLPASAGAGQSAVAVAATLSGLTPRTLYHYRMVATNAAGTAVGPDRTFKTPAAPPRAPGFSFAGPARMTLGQALGGRLRVRFHCSTACTARFTVTLALSGIRRLQAIPVALAHGSGRVGGSGYAHATLVFTGAARTTLLRGGGSVKLMISGYAVRGASLPSRSRTARLTLTR
jgi:phosphodiesterase/alkaline phosphatase D-like protein